MSSTPEEERSRRSDQISALAALLRAASVLRAFVREEEEQSMSQPLEAKQRPSPATKASIAALRRKEVAEEEGGECAICLSEYQVGSEVREMPCNHHWFHSDCVDKWLLVNGSCPVCRFPIPVDDR